LRDRDKGDEEEVAQVKIVFAALVAALGCNLIASPIDDLASPSPETRASAAKILQASYTPPSKTNWDSLLAELKTGDMRTKIEAMLSARGIKPGPGVGEALLMVEYRLDEAWLLHCRYRHQGQYRGKETLYDRSLSFSPKWIPVKTPTNFSGIWIDYYINGRKCLETSWKDGIRNGDRICYHYDGRKVYVEHHDPNSAEVDWTEFYLHSGSVKTKGKRDRTGRPIGTWTNFNDDGSVLNTTPWSRP
jgi:hypothetical protein